LPLAKIDQQGGALVQKSLINLRGGKLENKDA